MTKETERKVSASGWRSMESAPRDRTLIRALIHHDLYPRVKPARDDLARWNGQEIVIHHPGIADDGFDTGWSLSAPVGHGGFPDEWFVGWLPTGSAAPSPDTGGMGGDVRQEAAFLIARLDELSGDALTEEGAAEWHGHVAPSIARLRFALSAPVSVGEGEAVAWFQVWNDGTRYPGDPKLWPPTKREREYVEQMGRTIVPLYTHPASSDTERMRAALETARAEIVYRLGGNQVLARANVAIVAIDAALGEA
ncbi:hypothetical protein [Brevundimonas sp. FT23028]|uniref:hypothetical protein n=1 Tax=Brevundimonas sp. FT23028 TaxID=3393748 RepID=UPI003B58A39D